MLILFAVSCLRIQNVTDTTFSQSRESRVLIRTRILPPHLSVVKRKQYDYRRQGDLTRGALIKGTSTQCCVERVL